MYCEELTFTYARLSEATVRDKFHAHQAASSRLNRTGMSFRASN
ncbi:hypothetical protein ABIA24_002227 [Sinorhizobium fredii]